jgi:NifB/MoaA-like Fe-S oxidoreductase
MGKTKADCLLVPNVALRSGSGLFLDNVSLKDLEENLGIKVYPIEPTPEGLLEGILYECKRQN